MFDLAAALTVCGTTPFAYADHNRITMGDDTNVLVGFGAGFPFFGETKTSG